MTNAPKETAMANVTPQMVKELREKTGAGMMDCKGALTETGDPLRRTKRGVAWVVDSQ